MEEEGDLSGFLTIFGIKKTVKMQAPPTDPLYDASHPNEDYLFGEIKCTLRH